MQGKMIMGTSVNPLPAKLSYLNFHPLNPLTTGGPYIRVFIFY